MLQRICVKSRKSYDDEIVSNCTLAKNIPSVLMAADRDVADRRNAGRNGSGPGNAERPRG